MGDAVKEKAEKKSFFKGLKAEFKDHLAEQRHYHKADCTGFSSFFGAGLDYWRP